MSDGDPGQVDFDWSPEQWQEAGRRVLDVAAKVSSDWDGRRPAPAMEGEDVGARFKEALPHSPVDVDDLISRVEKDLVPFSAFNGHPRWFAYITASPTPISVLGELLASALNQNTALWRLAYGEVIDGVASKATAVFRN